MRRQLLLALCLSALCLAAGGCAHLPFMGDPLPVACENPMFVPVSDPDFLWNQVTDTVDDYFRIQQEQRPRATPEELFEGSIKTFPLIGASLLQPGRKDSVNFDERLLATLQTIRRRGIVRVVPFDQSGYLIEVIVLKELEDLNQPAQSTVGGSTIRHDGSLVRPIDQGETLLPVTLGWIPLGRDTALEQQMLREMRGRLIITSPPDRLPPIGH